MKRNKSGPFTPVMERDVEIRRRRNVVTISLHCKGAYEAQVLKEDFSERLRAGRMIAMVMQKSDEA